VNVVSICSIFVLVFFLSFVILWYFFDILCVNCIR